MISKKDEKKIKKIANKYGASKIILFGSSLDENKKSADIDLAVEGVPDSQFFSFYGELIFNLSKPIDIVDLKNKSKFNNLIISNGKIIYGKVS